MTGSRDARVARRAPLPLLLLAALLLMTLGSCTRIYKFTVTPNGYVCRGQELEIAWKTRGFTKLSAEPKVAGLNGGEVPQKGERKVTVDRSTMITIDADHWFGYELRNSQEITVVDIPVHKEISESIDCDGTSRVIARVELFMDPRVTVGQMHIEAAMERPVIIEHNGTRATVAPADPNTDAFRGMSAAGVWILRSELVDGQTCPGADLPPELSVLADLQCTNMGGKAP